MSGWQSSESTYLATLSRTLGRVTSRFPNGTLWVLNRAKLARYSRDPDSAVDIIVEALGKEKKEGNSFREADSLLVFEVRLYLTLSFLGDRSCYAQRCMRLTDPIVVLLVQLGWLKLSQAKWIETADAFEQMCDLNSWSHATYVLFLSRPSISLRRGKSLVLILARTSPSRSLARSYIAIAAGALIDQLNSQRLASPSSPLDAALVSRTEALLERLPGLCQQKRVFGEKPVTETFLVRRAEAHKAKKERWVQSGRIKPEAGVWEVVRLTNAMGASTFLSLSLSPLPSLLSNADLTTLPRTRRARPLLGDGRRALPAKRHPRPDRPPQRLPPSPAPPRLGLFLRLVSLGSPRLARPFTHAVDPQHVELVGAARQVGHRPAGVRPRHARRDPHPRPHPRRAVRRPRALRACRRPLHDGGAPPRRRALCVGRRGRRREVGEGLRWPSGRTSGSRACSRWASSTSRPGCVLFLPLLGARLEIRH